MLEISENDYREIQRIERLRKSWKISKAEFLRLIDEILAPLRQEEELRKQKEELRRKKQELRNEFHRKLRACDSGYGKRGGPFLQGGLPSLGKRR
jgi:hypothetical protein